MGFCNLFRFSRADDVDATHYGSERGSAGLADWSRLFQCLLDEKAVWDAEMRDLQVGNGGIGNDESGMRSKDETYSLCEGGIAIRKA